VPTTHDRPDNPILRLIRLPYRAEPGQQPCAGCETKQCQLDAVKQRAVFERTEEDKKRQVQIHELQRQVKDKEELVRQLEERIQSLERKRLEDKDTSTAALVEEKILSAALAEEKQSFEAALFTEKDNVAELRQKLEEAEREKSTPDVQA
jgi:sugar diacid utilization regulator